MRGAPIDIPEGTVCPTCGSPVNEGQLIFKEERGWVHGACRVFHEAVTGPRAGTPWGTAGQARISA